MSGRGRHLFVATNRAAFGEALVGLALARQLHAQGDYVAFLYPSTLSMLFQDVPFARATIDVAQLDLPRAIRAAVRDRGLDTVVLVDVVSVLGTTGRGVARAILRDAGARVLGVDLWNLPETDLTWDVGVHSTPIDPIALEIPCVRPCPIARPEAAGAFRSLPELEPLSPQERARVREQTGLSGDAPVLLLTTATWQQPNAYYRQIPRRLAERCPDIYELWFRRLPRGARLLHVGPGAFAWAADEPRYRWLPRVAPTEFSSLVAASDVLLSLNVPATSLAVAIACGVPALVMVNRVSGDTVDEVERAAGHRLPDDLRQCLAGVLPLRPFRVCPVGLRAFLEPVLAGNPYCDAFRTAELTDIDGAAAAATRLLEDDAERDRMRADQARYRERVARLPSAVERFRELCDG